MHGQPPTAPAPLRPRGRARLAAGAIALSAGVISAGLIAGAGTAYADVTSGTYTIGAPATGVTDVAASPGTVDQGASTNFEVTFTTGTALSGAGNDWVTVVPSEALGLTPANVDLIGSSCLQAGTTGSNGTGTATTTGITVELAGSCNISAGSKVEVDFTAKAPSTTGNLSFAVTTSGQSTPVSSNAVVVGVAGPTLSAASYQFGSNTTYTISAIPVANLTANGTTLTLTPVATTGTETITLYSGASRYSVTYTAPGGTATPDAVQDAVVSGQTATLTLANPVASGGSLDITATGTNPAVTGSSQSNSVTVQPGNGSAQTAGPVTFGNAVSGVTVTPSTLVAGAQATYTVGFDATDAVATGGQVMLSEVAGPTDFSTVSGILVADTTQGWHFIASGSALATGSAKVPLADAVQAGDSVTLTLVGVTNPPAGTIGDFAVSTTSDPVAVEAPSYSTVASTNPAVVVSVSPTTTGAVATYTISGLRSSAALTGGSSTLAIDAPAGTIFPSGPSFYNIDDATTASGSGTVKTVVSGGGTNAVVIDVPNNISAGDSFTLTAQDVINPTLASSSYSLTVYGNVTGPAPTTTTTTTVPPTSTPAHAPTIAVVQDKVYAHGATVKLMVHCHDARCTGTVELLLVRTVLGSKAYNIKKGGIGYPTFNLNSNGVKFLARKAGHTLMPKEVLLLDGGKTAGRKITLIG